MSPLRLDQVFYRVVLVGAVDAGCVTFNSGTPAAARLPPVDIRDPRQDVLAGEQVVGHEDRIPNLHVSERNVPRVVASITPSGHGYPFFDPNHLRTCLLVTSVLIVACGGFGMHTSFIGGPLLPHGTDAQPIKLAIGSSWSPELARVTAAATSATDRLHKGIINRVLLVKYTAEGGGGKGGTYLITKNPVAEVAVPGKQGCRPRGCWVYLLPMPCGSTQPVEEVNLR